MMIKTSYALGLVKLYRTTENRWAIKKHYGNQDTYLYVRADKVTGGELKYKHLSEEWVQ